MPYRYVGPEELATQAHSPVERLQPCSRDDLLAWDLRRGRRRLELTFVVDESGALCLSDRRTEHVACARGGRVLSAGELTLSFSGDAVSVESVTNQSTGYCPEPSSWPHVRVALESAGLVAPPEFTHAFDFRRCTACGNINVLKPEMPECACGADLPDAWNL